MLINTKIGAISLQKFMKLLVAQSLNSDYFKVPNGAYNVDLINMHIPNVNKTKYVHILYYIILYPHYLPLVTEFCKNNLIKIDDCTIQPDNIIDPINYCNDVFIPVLARYGFECNLVTTTNKFYEGIMKLSTVKIMIANNIITPEVFFSQIDYNNFINHMVFSIIAATKSMTHEKQDIIVEQYMLGLSLLFKYSRNIFTTQHLNKILTCKHSTVVCRIMRYIKLHPAKFSIIPTALCTDSEFVTEEIREIVNEYYIS